MRPAGPGTQLNDCLTRACPTKSQGHDLETYRDQGSGAVISRLS
jgi:hypothetical protein